MSTAIQSSPPPSRDVASLTSAWERLLHEQPKLRIRDAALQLEVSEAELRATRIGIDTVRLQGPHEDILRVVPEFGEVMALTRNEHAVHEKVGRYGGISFQGFHGLVIHEAIDLRLFMNAWHLAFAVREEGESIRRSLQFFTADGTAIHKTYLREDSAAERFDALVDAHAAADQSPEQRVEPPTVTPAPKPDVDIDVAGLQQAWLNLTDTHEFFPMLRRFGVARTQALRLAPDGHARPVTPDAIETVLRASAGLELPIMIFVGNRGCIQIHTGPVARIKPLGSWINVLDPGFNLHLRADAVASAWVVRKPTDEGTVTSLELFDADGENIALLFVSRKHTGGVEPPEWIRMLEALPNA